MRNQKGSFGGKVVAYGLLTIVLLAIYGIFTDFIPSVEFISAVQYASYTLSAILLVLFYCSFFKKGSRFREAMAKRQNIWLTALVMPIPIIMLPYMGFVSGAPAILHKMVSKPGSGIYKVTKKNSSYSAKRCTGGVHLDVPVFMKNQVCGIPRNVWQEIEPGDTLELVGSVSYFGLRYEKLRVYSQTKD